LIKLRIWLSIAPAVDDALVGVALPYQNPMDRSSRTASRP